MNPRSSEEITKFQDRKKQDSILETEIETSYILGSSSAILVEGGSEQPTCKKNGRQTDKNSKT